MELKNYSKEAVEEIRFQAYDHLFMGKNFQDNLDHVLEFEECTHMKILDPEGVYFYMWNLAVFSEIGPRIEEGLKQYLLYVGNHLPQDQREQRQLNWILNEIWNVYRKHVSLRRNVLGYLEAVCSSSCLHILEKYLLSGDSSSSYLDFMMDEMSRIFPVTALLLEDERDYSYALSGQKHFFDYIHFILDRCPDLIRNEDFLTRISFVLSYNQSLKELNSDPTSDHLNSLFFYKNNNMLRKIRKIAKEENFRLLEEW